MTLAELATHARVVIDEVERAVVGKRDRLELILAGLLADGHVLLEDVPGLAKTLTARSFAAVTGLRFARVQFTPDLLPSDVTGSSIWNQRDMAFEFRPGPVFSNILLADEINRAPPKTQAALLEAMQERQVSLDGVTHVLEPPFLVLATQNPIEYEGTYPLPEAQLDRFVLRTGFGYPAAEDEWEMLERRLERGVDEVQLREVVDRPTLLGMQRAVEGVTSTRASAATSSISSPRRARARASRWGRAPRGSLALVKLARCRAALAGRDFVTPDDVKSVAVPALAHRLVLRPSSGCSAAAARTSSARSSTRSRRPRRTPRRHVTRAADPRLGAYAALAAACFVAALALRRPELAIVAAPFGVLVALGVRVGPPGVRAWFELDRERALEGDELDATLTVRALAGVSRLEVGVVLPAGLELVDGRNPIALRLGPGEEREVPPPTPLRAGRRSRSATSGSGPAIWSGSCGTRAMSTDGARCGSTPRPSGSAAWSRRRTRRPRPGARSPGCARKGSSSPTPGRSSRATAPGRSTGVRRRAAAPSSSTTATRSATPTSCCSSTASPRHARPTRARSSTPSASPRPSPSRFLERRDRVGLVTFGGVLRWLEPGTGLVQRYRLVDALLETDVQFSYAWKDVDVIPARTLPSRALVVAVTPLLDERSVGALVDLRGRGHDLVVLEVSPEPYVVAGPDPSDAVALRLWRLQRADLRARLERLGVAMATLRPDTSLEEALEEVRAYRRHAHRVLR